MAVAPTPGKQTLGDLGREYGIGLREMSAANPGNDLWQLQTSDHIIIPSVFVLPAGPRTGIVINLAELRLYYYHPDGATVSTFPIAIGREGWQTPTTSGVVRSKEQNPTWYVPKSIQEESIRNNRPLPNSIPPGPNNPLGKYALKLTIPNILIHGTQSARSIGRRSSHGCIRLWDKDIEALFNEVPVGTPVRIVHEPFKVGIKDRQIFLESHEPLDDHLEESNNQLIDIAEKVTEYTKGRPYEVNWSKSESIANKASGIPTLVGTVE